MTAEPSEEQVDPRTVTRPVKLPQAGLEPNTGEPFTYFPKPFESAEPTTANPAKLASSKSHAVKAK